MILYWLLLTAFLPAAASAAQPAVFADGQCVVVWEDQQERVYFAIRNNRLDDAVIDYDITGASVNASGTITIPPQHQDSLAFVTPSPLALGNYAYNLVMRDANSIGDTLLWNAQATVAVVDSTIVPSVVPTFDPFTLVGLQRSSYQPQPKKTVVKTPKSPEKLGTTFLWTAVLTNVDPFDAGNLFQATPNAGSIVGDPGALLDIDLAIENGSPVDFGSMNRVVFVVSDSMGFPLATACTPVVGDSLDMIPVGVTGPAATETRSWSHLKELFR
ncbi:MAG: hypothetical protein HKN20_05515 [Gemmatimonadetes bacterium]|nr:hypothetical protein [Gemmatimonadota bacterium]